MSVDTSVNIHSLWLLWKSITEPCVNRMTIEVDVRPFLFLSLILLLIHLSTVIMFAKYYFKYEVDENEFIMLNFLHVYACNAGSDAINNLTKEKQQNSINVPFSLLTSTDGCGW